MRIDTRLAAHGFTGQIFCTAATMDFARILLTDSAKIQVQDMGYMNKQQKNQEQLPEPLYTEQQAMECLRLFKIVEYNEEYEITPAIKFVFTNAGHVIGSAAIHLTVDEDGKTTRLTFSGDIGRYGDMVLGYFQNYG